MKWKAVHSFQVSIGTSANNWLCFWIAVSLATMMVGRLSSFIVRSSSGQLNCGAYSASFAGVIGLMSLVTLRLSSGVQCTSAMRRSSAMIRSARCSGSLNPARRRAVVTNAR
jgi:hypothetical protein